MVTIFYIIFSFYNPSITNFKEAAVPNIPVLIDLSNLNIILHDVLLQLHSIFNGTNINHVQSYPIFGFLSKIP